jgi:hypothetical protein
MHTIQVTKSPEVVALRQGLTFAGIFVLLQTLVQLITNFVDIPYIGLIINTLNFLLSVVLFIFTGIFAARETGRTGTGALAGLAAGSIGGVGALIVTLVITALNMSALLREAQSAANSVELGFEYTSDFILATAVILAVIGLLFAVGLGAGVGALGGLIGKRQAPPPMQNHRQAPLPPPIP